MNHAIKIEDFPNLTVNKVERVSELLREVGYDLLGTDRVEEIECRHRDGFSPWSHNKGGWRNSGYTSIDSIVGSGYTIGSGKADEIIERRYCEETKDCLETFLESENLDGSLTWDDLKDDQLNDYYNFESEWFNNADGYLDICVEYQGKYLSYDKGVHTISLNVFISILDAPYFRSSEDDIEIVLSFRDMDSVNFKKKLEKAIKELEHFTGNVDLW